MPTRLVKVAVVGASGYTGGEILRLLSGHPHVKITLVTAEKSAGQPVSSLFPNLGSVVPHHVEHSDPQTLIKRADVVFLALPHTKSMPFAKQCIQGGKIVLDLSADFRLNDPKVYESWYQTPHIAPHLLHKAVYGLPELYRSKIRKARLVAVPGCYPTAAILQLAPLVAKGLVRPGGLIVDAKSGISGAGRSPAQLYHFPESHDSIKAYKIGEHRHLPEIEQVLQAVAAKHHLKRPKSIKVVFVPHLVPMNRGLISTAYSELTKAVSTEELRRLYRTFYRREPFVRILDDPLAVSPSHVRGSNFCDIGVFRNKQTGHVVTIAAIDNLVKGAAGQALQSMNILLGFPEELGLSTPGFFP